MLTNAAQQHIENVLASESLNIHHPSSLRSVAIGTIGRGDVILITRNGCRDGAHEVCVDGRGDTYYRLPVLIFACDVHHGIFQQRSNFFVLFRCLFMI